MHWNKEQTKHYGKQWVSNAKIKKTQNRLVNNACLIPNIKDRENQLKTFGFQAPKYKHV